MARHVEQGTGISLDSSWVPISVRNVNDDPLSVRLRHSCAAEHRALEDMIGARGTEMALGSYVSLLLMFRALHRASDDWRRRFEEECRRHGVPRENPGLVDLIDHDLKALGVQPVPTRVALFDTDHDTGFPIVLGGLYVVVGSALGNALMLRQVRSSFDTTCAGATAFLAASAGEAGPTFQALRLCLDDFGMTAPTAQQSVVDGARQTFMGCATTFRSLRA